jgi:hypothetical protein
MGSALRSTQTGHDVRLVTIRPEIIHGLRKSGGTLSRP